MPESFSLDPPAMALTHYWNHVDASDIEWNNQGHNFKGETRF